jgi:hypothetical protein
MRSRDSLKLLNRVTGPRRRDLGSDNSFPVEEEKRVTGRIGKGMQRKDHGIVLTEQCNSETVARLHALHLPRIGHSRDGRVGSDTTSGVNRIR